MSDTFVQSILNKQRVDKFIMVVNLPPLLKDINKKLTRSNSTIQSDYLQFSIYGVVVPKIEFHHSTLRYSGQSLNVSSLSRVPYNSVTVNFTVDNMFNNYWVIYKWLDFLNNDKIGIYDSEEPDLLKNVPMKLSKIQNQYKSTISVFGLDEYNKRVIEFKYTNALPVSLNGINYNYRDPSEMVSGFEFYFDQLLVELIDSDELNKSTPF